MSAASEAWRLLPSRPREHLIAYLEDDTREAEQGAFGRADATENLDHVRSNKAALAVLQAIVTTKVRR